jgi:hypothetical protein
VVEETMIGVEMQRCEDEEGTEVGSRRGYPDKKSGDDEVRCGRERGKIMRDV